MDYPERFAPWSGILLDSHAAERRRKGWLYGLAAYGLWGLMPLYFKHVIHVAPLALVAHRIVWTCLFLLLLVACGPGWSGVVEAVRSRRRVGLLLGSALAIAVNWLVYVYAVATEQIVQASLGYFITPLVNVGLGVLILHERLDRVQAICIGLAATGVLGMTIAVGGVPWIAILLAISFGLYGLTRKQAGVDTISGLMFETLVLLPLSIVLIATQSPGPQPLTLNDHLLLALGGLVTGMPLLFFGAAATRLPMVALGVLQYLAPSMQLLLAVFLYGEPFTRDRMFGFACIWSALAIYTLSAIFKRRSGG